MLFSVNTWSDLQPWLRPRPFVLLQTTSCFLFIAGYVNFSFHYCMGPDSVHHAYGLQPVIFAGSGASHHARSKNCHFAYHQIYGAVSFFPKQVLMISSTNMCSSLPSGSTPPFSVEHSLQLMIFNMLRCTAIVSAW